MRIQHLLLTLNPSKHPLNHQKVVSNPGTMKTTTLGPKKYAFGPYPGHVMTQILTQVMSTLYGFIDSRDHPSGQLLTLPLVIHRLRVTK